MLNHLGNFIKTNRIILILILIYVIIFASLSILRHTTFQTQTWDLAVFEQSFWNTIHGDMMFNNFEGKNHFAIHFSPILLLLVPFYGLWQTPELLLILQALALGLGALPLYLLAQRLLNRNWALLVAGLYLLYPSLHWVNLFDFHAVPFAIPLIVAALYLLEIGRYRWLGLSLGLTALVAENMIVAVFFIGLYILLFKNKKIGILTMVSAGLYFVVVANIFMPALGGGIVRLDRYSQFGATLPEIITNIITQPQLTAQTVLVSSKMIYLLKILLPVMFLPLIGWPSLPLLIPGLLQNLLTNLEFQFTNFYQYDSILIPFIFFGVILGLSTILHLWPDYKKYVASLLALFGLTGLLWISPLSPWHFPLERLSDERTRDLAQIIELIPADVSVAAHTNLVPHLTHRAQIYMAGQEPLLVDYLILDSNDLFGFPDQATFDRYLEQYRQAGIYQATWINDRYVIFHRRP